MLMSCGIRDMADQYKDHKPGLAILNDVPDFSCRFFTMVDGLK